MPSSASIPRVRGGWLRHCCNPPSSCLSPGPGCEGDSPSRTPLQSGDVSAHSCVPAPACPCALWPQSSHLDSGPAARAGRAQSSCLSQVVCMSFFDIVLDFILMDAFEDLESPPASVLAVLRNRWLSDSFKETVGGRPAPSTHSHALPPWPWAPRLGSPPLRQQSPRWAGLPPLRRAGQSGLCPGGGPIALGTPLGPVCCAFSFHAVVSLLLVLSCR